MIIMLKKDNLSKAIVLLSLTSCILILIGCLEFFVSYEYVKWGYESNYYVNGYWETRDGNYELTFHFPENILKWVRFILTVSPAVFLLFISNNKAKNIMDRCFSFVWRCFSFVLRCFNISFNIKGHKFFDSDVYPITIILGLCALNSILSNIFASSFLLNGVTLFCIIYIFLCILTILVILFKNNFVVLIGITVIFKTIFDGYLLMQSLQNIEFMINHNFTIYLLILPTKAIGSILLHATLYLISILHTKMTRQIISPKAQQNNMLPEDELLYLQEQFNQGNITEEEYQNQRAEIISKL